MNKIKIISFLTIGSLLLGLTSCDSNKETQDKVQPTTTDNLISHGITEDTLDLQGTSPTTIMTVDGYSIEIPETLDFFENNNEISRFFSQNTASSISVPHFIAENEHYISITVGTETKEELEMYLVELKSVVQEIRESEEYMSVEFEIIDENTEFTAKSGQKFQYISHYLMTNDKTSTEPCFLTMIFIHETGNVWIDATCDTSADTEALKKQIIDMMFTIEIGDSGLKTPVVDGEFLSVAPIFTD